MKCRVWTREKQDGCISNYTWNSVSYKISPKHSAPVFLGEKQSVLKRNHGIWRLWQISISHHCKSVAPHYSWVMNFYKHNTREAVVSSSTEAIWWTLGRSLHHTLIQQGLGQLKYYGYVLLVTRLGNGGASHVKHRRWHHGCRINRSHSCKEIPRSIPGVKTRWELK